MSKFTLSGAVDSDGKAITLARALELPIMDSRTFELDPGDAREFTYDPDDGGTLKLLLIKAVKKSDPTQLAEIQFSNNDNDGADPPNGTNWVEVNGLEMTFREQPLSDTNNSFYLYNAGDDVLVVDMVAGLEGA